MRLFILASFKNNVEDQKRNSFKMDEKPQPQKIKVCFIININELQHELVTTTRPLDVYLVTLII